MCLITIALERQCRSHSAQAQCHRYGFSHSLTISHSRSLTIPHSLDHSLIGSTELVPRPIQPPIHGARRDDVHGVGSAVSSWSVRCEILSSSQTAVAMVVPLASADPIPRSAVLVDRIHHCDRDRGGGGTIALQQHSRDLGTDDGACRNRGSCIRAADCCVLAARQYIQVFVVRSKDLSRAGTPRA